MKKICFSLFILALSVTNAIAEDSTGRDVFQKIADDAQTFFAPLSGRIISVDDGMARIGIGLREGVRKGMRLKVFREGEDFFHPVTGELLGKIESEVGTVEVVSAEQDEGTVKTVKGSIEVADRVRITSGALPVLFYQTKGVDWSVGDALFRAFKSVRRFEIYETGLDDAEPAVMLKELVDRNAVFSVFVRQRDIYDHAILSVSFYHTDGEIFYDEEIELSEDQLNDLKFGYSFLHEIDKALRLAFEVPGSTEFISSCDINGDGDKELVMIIGSELEVFQFDVDLKLLYHKDIANINEPIWMDCEDLNGDNKAEIIVSSVVENKETRGDESKSDNIGTVAGTGSASQVFSLHEGRLDTLYNTLGFLRVIKGDLYFQSFSSQEGFSGDVYTVDLEAELKKGGKVSLPAGANIYDFYPVWVEGKKGNLIIDDSAYINVFNNDGLRVWRSDENVGGFLREFEISSPTVMVQKEKWYGKDRIMPYKGRLLMIKRNLIAKNARGLGFSSSEVIGMGLRGALVETQPILKDIGGSILDFTIMDDKIITLVKPMFGLKAGNILKGRSPFKRNLYVFSLP